MGCRLTRNELLNKNVANEMPQSVGSDTKIDYKSRLERKMCLAKETPELNYDLSDCNLKDIPAGVFVLCRVLRKEVLDLSKNRLTSLNNGGVLSDLFLLKVLDLRYNKIKQLPDEIYKLENLRELLISNNFLVKVPKTINKLKYLELLDISFNNIQSIDEINFMPRLKILNLTANKSLLKLSDTLTTCDNLYDIIIDTENIEWPPKDILESGTLAIMRYLAEGIVYAVELKKEKIQNDMTDHDKHDDSSASSNSFDVSKKVLKDKIEKSVNKQTQNLSCDASGYGSEDKLLMEIQMHQQKHQYNAAGYGCEDTLIREIQIRQQKHKQEVLQAIMNQQYETEFLVNRIQQQKDNEKNKLIRNILEAEENANLVINNLLVMKNSYDLILLEKEQVKEERLLEKLHLKHSELRKQEILATMLDELHDVECRIQDYQNQKTSTSQDILEREFETSTQLRNFYTQYEKNRGEIINKICEDEELQKKAVINLIAKNDARTWGLVEQLKIIEAQLANMTQLEIKKKNLSAAEQMNELSDKRICLTKILTDLLNQQEDRKKQLLSMLLSMEAQKSNEQDFWLLQYQRLLDSRPLEFSVKTNSIDPLLGYNFLVNGVIHCLPFLQKLWQNNNIQLNKLTDDDLKTAGIREERDRRLILRSIEEYIQDISSAELKCTNPSAPVFHIEDEAGGERSFDQGASIFRNNTQTMSECVICMEDWVKIIFLPCGHMCCCLKCEAKILVCPMCRAVIERKIKIVQV